MLTVHGIISDTIKTKYEKNTDVVITPYDQWLFNNIPQYDIDTLADYHKDAWEWSDEIKPFTSHSHLILCLGRNLGKSTLAESMIVKLASEKRRNYIWIVSETQTQADKTVKNISLLIDNPYIKSNYPEFAKRKLTSYGHSQGWTRQFLYCGNNVVIEAIGLNKAIRSSKVDFARPDFILFNDVDSKKDSQAKTDQKENLITEDIIPAGDRHVIVMFCQNLIQDDSICHRLVRDDNPATYLNNREIIGPIPLVDNLKYDEVYNDSGAIVRRIITNGIPTWPRYTIPDIQHLLDTQGYMSFKRESQQDIPLSRSKGLISPSKIQRITHVNPNDLEMIIVIVDPSGADNDEGDNAGIIVLGVNSTYHEPENPVLFYVLSDDSTDSDPENWANQSVASYYKYDAEYMVVERNYGGKMVDMVIKAVDPAIDIRVVNASQSKIVRGEATVQLYNDKRVFHVGVFAQLQRELTTKWSKSPNRFDALVHGINHLLLHEITEGSSTSVG